MTMSDVERRRCRDEIYADFSSTELEAVVGNPPTEADVPPLPSATMTTPEYLRIHANAPPSKLRNIIKNEIFPRDDVKYLKRLVYDMGNMEFVFRFLWYDGPKPVSHFEEWDVAPVKSPSQRAAAGKSESLRSSTRGESNWGNSSCGSKRVATTGSSGRSKAPQSPARVSMKTKESRKSGRTWIQYCCYYNAHQCLQWIFREILRNHLAKVKEDEVSKPSIERESSQQIFKEGNFLYIIKQLLEYPSPCYCAAHYVAVATLRNSHDCLLLLLQYGGLDPNMAINSHGSTAAHLAAWKDNAECLRVLQAGCYNVSFLDESFISEEWIAQSSASGESDEENETGYDAVLDRHGALTSISTAPLGDIKTWAADWNIINAQGETPVHVAAREGSCDAMQFFLDITISFVEAAAMRNLDSVDVEVVRTHCLSEDGGDIGNNSMPSHHLDKVNLSSSPPVDFSLRNNEGMDCATLAAKSNHACIIKLLGRAIQQIRDIENEKKHGAKRTGTDGFVQNPFSLLSNIPQDRSGTKPLPQSHLSSHLRRRANTDPVSVHIEQRTLNKVSQSEHGLKQFSLPRHYPSLDLRHPHEQNNHEAAIHVAAREGNASVVKALFDSGCCDTPARDSLGQTALHIAVLNGCLEVCQFFAELNFEQFTNFDVVDILGRTPLYIACSLGNSSIARILTPVSNWRVICHERRKSPDGPLYTNVAQQPPLHAAVVNDHVNTVSVLLECGVDVDQLDVDGRTAINASAKLGYYDMCQMLILHGANVNARSSKGGPTPYQKAKKYKHSNVADLLYEFGGR